MFPREKQDRQTGSTQTSTRRVSSRVSVKTSRRAVSSDVKNDSNHHIRLKSSPRAPTYSPPLILIIISKHHPSANATFRALATALTLAKTFSRSFSSSLEP